MKEKITINTSPECLDGISIIIPSLNPDKKLIQTVNLLCSAGFRDLIVVNDGSSPDHTEPFRVLEKQEHCTVLTHPHNRGKGAALKTAFSYLLENRPGLRGVVTVDADGQHMAHDVVNLASLLLQRCDEHAARVAETRAECVSSDGHNSGYHKHIKVEKVPLIIGVRDFSESSVPLRSRFGNRTTSMMFRLIFNLKISDTQTGLRAIAAEHLPAFMHLSGDRYEYETNMLLACSRYGIDIEEQTISTVYIDDNAGSHFRPVRDAIRIYMLMFKFIFSSLAATLIDFAAFNVLLNTFDLTGFIESREMLIMTATVISRIISSLCNFSFNSTLVFECTKSRFVTILKYYAICIPQMLVSGILVSFLSGIFSDSNIVAGAIKLIVDIALFLISFRIQRGWVFAEDTE